MRTTPLVAALASAMLLLGARTQADSFSDVAIPMVNNNIQTGLISTFPTTTFTANNGLATTFNVAGNGLTNCGPGSNAACNFYDAFGFSGAGNSITLNVSVADPTNVFTLMNAYRPAATQLATIEFLGTGGTNLTFSLIGGNNIRDFYQGQFTNALTNTVPGVNAENAFTCSDPRAVLAPAVPATSTPA